MKTKEEAAPKGDTYIEGMGIEEREKKSGQLMEEPAYTAGLF